MRALRVARGLSQADLAASVGLSANHLGVLERGQKVPTLETVEAIAQSLGTRVTDLLEDEPGTDPWARQLVTLAASVPPGLRSLVIAVVSAIVRHQPRERTRRQ